MPVYSRGNCKLPDELVKFQRNGGKGTRRRGKGRERSEATMEYFKEEKTRQRLAVIPPETLQKLFPFDLAVILYRGQFNDVLKGLN